MCLKDGENNDHAWTRILRLEEKSWLLQKELGISYLLISVAFVAIETSRNYGCVMQFNGQCC